MLIFGGGLFINMALLDCGSFQIGIFPLSLIFSFFLFLFSLSILKGKRWAMKVSLVLIPLMIFFTALSIPSFAYYVEHRPYIPEIFLRIYENIHLGIILISIFLTLFSIYVLKRKKWAIRASLILIPLIAFLIALSVLIALNLYMKYYHGKDAIYTGLQDFLSGTLSFIPYILILPLLFLGEKDYQKIQQEKMNTQNTQELKSDYKKMAPLSLALGLISFIGNPWFYLIFFSNFQWFENFIESCLYFRIFIPLSLLGLGMGVLSTESTRKKIALGGIVLSSIAFVLFFFWRLIVVALSYGAW